MKAVAVSSESCVVSHFNLLHNIVRMRTRPTCVKIEFLLVYVNPGKPLPHTALLSDARPRIYFLQTLLIWIHCTLFYFVT